MTAWTALTGFAFAFCTLLYGLTVIVETLLEVFGSGLLAETLAELVIHPFPLTLVEMVTVAVCPEDSVPSVQLTVREAAE